MDENTEPWEKNVPADLISAIKPLRQSFDDAHWKCGRITQVLCFSQLHKGIADEDRKEYIEPLQQLKMIVGSAATRRFHELLKQRTPPAIFKGFYDLYLDSIRVQALAIFMDMVEIARANEQLIGTPHLEWATSQIRHLIRSEAYRLELWVRDVCDKKIYDPNEDIEEQIFWRKWQAPLFLIMRPSRFQPYQAARTWDRMDAQTSLRSLKFFAEHYVRHLEIQLNKVAGRAAVELAKQAKPMQNSTADTGSQGEDFLRMPRAERRDRPINAPAQSTDSGTAVTEKSQSLSGKADRRAAIDSYIQEVFERTGKPITRADIWKAARYRTRSEFERWQRCDGKATKAAHERFARILTEKPHLK